MNNYFEVKCKCGHVGRDKYIPITFYIVAENGKDAAAKGRAMPRVKHDHKDCIISVKKIDYELYRKGRIANENDPYLCCSNRQQQRMITDIGDRLIDEEYETECERKYSKYNGIRNLKKYMKMRSNYSFDNYRYDYDAFC